MFEFRWQIPDAQGEVVLELQGRSGWFGRKVLRVGTQTIFRRGYLEGIEQHFRHPQSDRRLWLHVVPVAGTADWRPALFHQQQEIPESSGTVPPRVVQHPGLLRIAVSGSYLLMLMAVVMLPSIVRILNAMHQGPAEGAGAGVDYSAYRDIVPWVLPVAVSAVCLLGYWSMRRWSVWAYGSALVIQLVLWITDAVPVAGPALVPQGLLLAMGMWYWNRMR